jgi:Ca2+-binding RTX toxin-like protein
MATIQASNALGVGLNMSGFNSAGWGYAPSDNLTGTLYRGYNTIIFDAYGYDNFSAMGVNYYLYSDYNTVELEDIYYFQGSIPVLKLDNVNILTSIDDLNASAWYVRYNQGPDSIYGNDYADIIKGGYGNDYLVGYGGKDVIYGGYDNDRLYGGAANDKLLGESGNDLLYGGIGIDYLTGGAGYDYFVFDTKASSTNYDVITDFSVTYDTIRVDNAVYTKAGANGALASKAFWASTSGKAHDSNDRFIYDKDGGQLYYDADGTGAGAAVKIAQLKAGLAMTYKDMYVI